LTTLLVELCTFVTPTIRGISFQSDRQAVFSYIEGVSVEASKLDSVFPFANAEMGREALAIKLIGKFFGLLE
jgi:hypothetical protein